MQLHAAKSFQKKNLLFWSALIIAVDNLNVVSLCSDFTSTAANDRQKKDIT